MVAPHPLGSPLIARDFRVAAACVIAGVALISVLVFVVTLDLVVAPRPLGLPLIACNFRVVGACVVARVALDLKVIAACVCPWPSSTRPGRYMSM